MLTNDTERYILSSYAMQHQDQISCIVNCKIIITITITIIIIIIIIIVGDPTSTRDKEISLYISGYKPQPYEPVLWG